MCAAPFALKGSTMEVKSGKAPKRALIVLSASLICALIGLLLSAVILTKDVRNTATVTLEIKNRSALVAATGDIEKSIALYRDTNEALQNDVSVRELRRNVSFTDDDVTTRTVTRALQQT